MEFHLREDKKEGIFLEFLLVSTPGNKGKKPNTNWLRQKWEQLACVAGKDEAGTSFRQWTQGFN